MNEIKILGLLDGGGSKYHRIKLPLEALNGKTVLINGHERIIKIDFLELHNSKDIQTYRITEPMVEGYDIVWWNWGLNNPLWEISELKNKFGFKLFMDCDDLWDLPESHLKKDNDYNFIPLQLVQSDVVITPSERLVAHIGQFNDYVHYSPNYLPLPEERVRKEGKVAIGLIGGYEHVPDWLSVRSAIMKLANDSEIHKKCKFVIAGYKKGKEWDSVVSMCKNASKAMEVEVLEGKSPETYLELFDHIDIVLQPLLDTEFNHCKSNLRLQECGGYEIPVVGSKLYEEKGGGSIIVAESPKDYYKAIKYLIKDDNYKKIGKDCREVIKNTCKFEDRIEGLWLLVESVMNGAVKEKDIEEVKIFQIKYDNSQEVEYISYDNSHIRSVEDKSFLYEWNPVIEIIDNPEKYNIEKEDLVGIFSWKFARKTNVPKKLLYKILEETMVKSPKAELYSLSPNFFTMDYLSYSNEQHPGFMDIFLPLCKDLGLSVKEPKFPCFSNFFVAKYEIYANFVNNCIKPAIELLETKYKDAAFKDAQYKSGLEKDKLKEFTGMEYYTFHTFLLERLVGIWIDNKGIKTIQLR